MKQWILSRLRKREIYDRDGTDLYLTRRYFFGGDRSRFALILHQMHRPDNDACHHDHPWSFFTLVLKGGYVEEITRPDGSHNVRKNRPGTLLFRKATHTHRIASLPTGECWTLVFRFPKTRSWGFWTDQGWIPWRTFIDLRNSIPWCGQEK